MDEIVIGYDERRPEAVGMSGVFLLRDVTSVRSADRYVWPSLRDEISFSLAGKSHPESVVIAITFLAGSEAEQEGRAYFRSLNEACTPKTLPSNAVRLGYDVCGQTLVSGLVNCAYSAEERGNYARRWASSLNDLHLFENPDDAVRFALETSKRVPEHAPFYGFGLYECG